MLDSNDSYNWPQVPNRVSDFIVNLYEMVDSKTTSHVVDWTSTGDSFQITDFDLFTTEILPLYFNTSPTTFLRQLNLYDFKKIK